MTQKIDIDVGANTSGANANIRQLDSAAKSAASSMERNAKAAEKLASAMKQVERSAETLKSVKNILEREKRKPFSDDDVKKFLDNWDRMRKSRSIGSQRVRQFDDFPEWYRGHTGTFQNASDARAHRMRMIQVGLQGTAYAAQYGEPPVEEEPPGPQPWWRRTMGRVAGRAPSMAMSMVGSTLALAGIGAVGSMVGKANELYSDEAISINTLRRRMGDLGESFDKLQAQTRAATGGLAVTYVESAKLANEYVRVSGGRGGIRGLRQGLGLSAAFGIDNASGVDFMATMQRLGVTGGRDNENRRLANMIADAIKKGGYPAKADEMISAVQSFAITAARMSLSTPNVEGYASELAALTGTKRPGMTPGDTASMLATADAAQRQGGAFGEASMNLSMRAFQQQFGIRDPFASKALWQQGLFGTPQRAFGAGGPFAGWVGRGKFSNQTVLQAVRQQIKREAGGNDELATEFASNQWGVPLAFARQLMTADPAKLSKSERDKIEDKFNQYQDPGQAILKSTKDITDELTRLGGNITPILNRIKESVEALAQHLAPEEYKAQLRYEQEAKTDFIKKYKSRRDIGLSADTNLRVGAILGLNPDVPKLDDAIKMGSARFDASVKAGNPSKLDDLFPYFDNPWWAESGSVQNDYSNAVRQGIEKHMRDVGFDAHGNRIGGGSGSGSGGPATSGTRSAIQKAARALVDKYAAKYAARAGMSVADFTKLAEAQAMQESSMGLRTTSPTGVHGIMQVTRRTARGYGLNRDIPDENVNAGLHYLADLIHSKGRIHDALMAYNGGGDPLYADKILKHVKFSHEVNLNMVDSRGVPLNRVSLQSFNPGGASGYAPLPAFNMGLGADGG